MSDQPNRILEASAHVERQLAVLNETALQRLMLATSIDGTIADIFQTQKNAAFHAGVINADEALTICQALGPCGFKAEVKLALRLTITEVVAILMRGCPVNPNAVYLRTDDHHGLTRQGSVGATDGARRT